MAASVGLLLVMIIFVYSRVDGLRLSPNFYRKSCPNVVQIVASVAHKHFKQDPSMGAPIVRMFFHDCFVRGCDASVLLVSANNTAERDSAPNLTLAQFDVIDEIKANLERACPATVSCADIIALAAREAVLQSGGPSWTVELGRRDGLVSKDTEAAAHLPSSLSNAQTLIDAFESNGLSIRDLVALSGAHTFGKSHCKAVSRRLYSSGSRDGIDPSLNKTFALKLRSMCPQPVDSNSKIPLDAITPNTFDNVYYKNLLQNEGIFSSDAALLQEPISKAFVQLYAQDEDSFRNHFAVGMISMGRLGYLASQQQPSEIRQNCDSVNSA